MNQLNIFEARKLRDEGMEQAEDAAISRVRDWPEQALEFLKRYPASKFMTEEVRVWSYKMGLTPAPSGRAWGSVIATARKLGLIRHVGYSQVSNPKAHAANASVWEKI